ncbi:MAG: flagellar basal body-associated FliL family protein [Paracoccaceae bacterium]
MIKKLLPLLLGLVGLGAGIGAGLALRPPPPEPTAEEIAAAAAVMPTEPPEYVKLNNQFIVPVVEEGRVVSMVILTLSLEVEPGAREKIYSLEPKLRDVLLQVLFDHANSGGFRGAFTDSANLVLLRDELFEAAVAVTGDISRAVLISDIARQDT